MSTLASPAIKATGSGGGRTQGLAGISQTITVPDTAVPVNCTCRSSSISGHRHTWHVHRLRLQIPEITGDIFLIGIPFNAATLDAFSFPEHLDCPSQYRHQICKVDRTVDRSLGTGGLLPIKIPLIDIPAGPDLGLTTTPSSGFFNAGTGYRVGALATWAAIVPGFFNLTSGSSNGVYWRADLPVGSTSVTLSPALSMRVRGFLDGQSLRRRECRCYRRLRQQHPDPQPRVYKRRQREYGHGTSVTERRPCSATRTSAMATSAASTSSPETGLIQYRPGEPG